MKVWQEVNYNNQNKKETNKYIVLIMLYKKRKEKKLKSMGLVDRKSVV